jgi:hypothetical protein
MEGRSCSGVAFEERQQIPPSSLRSGVGMTKITGTYARVPGGTLSLPIFMIAQEIIFVPIVHRSFQEEPAHS